MYHNISYRQKGYIRWTLSTLHVSLWLIWFMQCWARNSTTCQLRSRYCWSHNIFPQSTSFHSSPTGRSTTSKLPPKKLNGFVYLLRNLCCHNKFVNRIFSLLYIIQFALKSLIGSWHPPFNDSLLWCSRHRFQILDVAKWPTVADGQWHNFSCNNTGLQRMIAGRHEWMQVQLQLISAENYADCRLAEFWLQVATYRFVGGIEMAAPTD